jgi:P-type Cu2+ transporter
MQAFWIVIVILVVTCPCALSLATPVALIAATGRLMQFGVLTTRGHALETLAKVTHVVFDKTGTLTHGQLQVDAIDVFAGRTREEVLDIAASLERGSEHPLARAIIACAPHANRHVVERLAIPGQGMQGVIAGMRYRLGRPGFVSPAGAEAVIENDAVRTAIVLADEQTTLAVFYLTDRLRDDAAATIKSLHALGVKVSLCSGDHQQLVTNIAQQLGITTAHGGLLPPQKLAYVQALQQRGEIVAMIGDGVNDAPVLAAAQVSIAMGSGTQLAQASSDMVLLSERLQMIVMALQLARRTHQVIRQNLGWAILYNVVALPLAAIGWITPWMAGIGMSGSSLVVVFNALGLRRFGRE